MAKERYPRAAFAAKVDHASVIDLVGLIQNHTPTLEVKSRDQVIRAIRDRFNRYLALEIFDPNDVELRITGRSLKILSGFVLILS